MEEIKTYLELFRVKCIKDQLGVYYSISLIISYQTGLSGCYCFHFVQIYWGMSPIQMSSNLYSFRIKETKAETLAKLGQKMVYLKDVGQYLALLLPLMLECQNMLFLDLDLELIWLSNDLLSFTLLMQLFSNIFFLSLKDSFAFASSEGFKFICEPTVQILAKLGGQSGSTITTLLQISWGSFSLAQKRRSSQASLHPNSSQVKLGIIIVDYSFFFVFKLVFQSTEYVFIFLVVFSFFCSG